MHDPLIVNIMRHHLLAGLCLAPLVIFQASAQERTEDYIFAASDLSSCQFFGRKVASSGEWFFVVSHTCDVQGFSAAGTVTVYRRTASGIEWFDELDSGSPFDAETLGENSISAFGDTLAVSSDAWPDQFAPEGRVCVFHFDGTRWNLETTLSQAVSVPQDGYGTDVIVTEDTIYVGASGANAFDTNGNVIGRGALYIYQKINGVWTEVDIWTPPNLPAYNGTYAGGIIGADNDTLVLGAHFRNRLDILEKDAAGIWQIVQSIQGIALVSDWNEWDVEVNGDTIVVGIDDSNLGAPGNVHVLKKTSGIWSQRQILLANNNPPFGDGFGRGVDLEEKLLVGAHSGGNDPGAAYLYSKDSAGDFQLEWKLVREAQNIGQAQLGFDVALSGDTALVGDRIAQSLPGTFPGHGTALFFDLPMGEVICAGVSNSTGSSAELEIVGSKVASEGYLLFRAKHLPLGRAGVFLGSQVSGFTPNPGGSSGNLCLGGAFMIFNKGGQYGIPNAAGEFELQVDTASIPFNPGAPILAGQSWTFQMWYRDHNPGSTTNFSPAVEVTFQ